MIKDQHPTVLVVPVQNINMVSNKLTNNNIR